MAHSNTNPRSDQYLTHLHSHITRAVWQPWTAVSPISARRLCHADEAYSNKAETAVHGCHCPGDIALLTIKVPARPWVGIQVCHFYCFFFCTFFGIFSLTIFIVSAILIECHTSSARRLSRTSWFSSSLKSQSIVNRIFVVYS